MIFSIMRTGFMILIRDRGALVLTFVLPIAFFSIFAGVFGNQKNSTSKIRIAVVDQDQSEGSKRLVQALQAEVGLIVQLGPKGKPEEVAKDYDAASAETAVRNGDMPVAIIIPKGYGESPIGFVPNSSAPKLRLLNDSSDPIAPQIVFGLLQKTVMTAMPDVMATQGSKYFEQYSGGLTPEQKKVCLDIVQEINNFGVSQLQKVYLIQQLALELEDREVLLGVSDQKYPLNVLSIRQLLAEGAELLFLDEHRERRVLRYEPGLRTS